MDRRLIVHRAPAGGRYTLTYVLHPGDRIAPLAFPTDELEVIAMTGRGSPLNG